MGRGDGTGGIGQPVNARGAPGGRGAVCGGVQNPDKWSGDGRHLSQCISSQTK